MRAGASAARPKPVDFTRASWPITSATRFRPISSAGTARGASTDSSRELRDVVKQADPDGLVTYASYPPTEYLDLSFLDFVTFNVYLHDHAAFRDYRLPPAKPGRRPPAGPGRARPGHAPAWRGGASPIARGPPARGRAHGPGRGLRLLLDRRLAHRRASRSRTGRSASPTPTAPPRCRITPCSRSSRRRSPDLLEETPRVSVVVCSYNGGATLDECLRSLLCPRLSGLRGHRRG